MVELAPDAAIDANPAWRVHLESVKDRVEIAGHDDLIWADAYAFGTPTRYGNVASQLKQVIDSTGPLWADGHLMTGRSRRFTSAGNVHGGNGSTILALCNTMYHWGSIIVPPGYTDPSVSAALGNPYGTAHPSRAGAPGEEILAAARHQGRRLATATAALLDGRRD